MRTLIFLLATLPLAGCSSGERPTGGASGSGDFCEGYAATCTVEPELEECNMLCANGTDPTGDDSCWFKACAVMTGKCDNEEPGDPSILLCGIDNGWYDPTGECSSLATDCGFCPTTEQTSECMAVADAGDDLECVAARARLPDCY